MESSLLTSSKQIASHRIDGAALILLAGVWSVDRNDTGTQNNPHEWYEPNNVHLRAGVRVTT